MNNIFFSSTQNTSCNLTTFAFSYNRITQIKNVALQEFLLNKIMTCMRYISKEHQTLNDI